MSANVSKGFLGNAIWKKVSGSGTLAPGEATIPFISFDPRDPYNNTYPPMVNKTAFPSVYVVGKRTPSLNIATALKASYATADRLNSMIVTTDANGDTDLYAFQDTLGAATRIYDGARCAALSLAGNNGGGVVGFESGWLCKTAQGSTSFGAAGASDAGALISACAVDFGAAATAQYVRSWRVNLIRGQNYDMWVDNTLYAVDTSSGQLGGTLQLEFSDKASTVPTTTVTIRLFSTVGGGSPALTITLKLNLDEPILTHTTGFGNQINTYTLIDTSAGGTPVTFA